MKVDLDEREWNWLMNVLATKLTWAEANPMLMKIGDQLRRGEQPHPTNNPPDHVKGNSGERPDDRSN
jgi:hypothetical protein